MTTTLRRINKYLAERSGWRVGSDLENRVAYQLDRWGFRPDEVAQQHRVGAYRLDFAWPKKLIGLEVDGLYHRLPDNALRDSERDSWLRNQGWLMFRIDDHTGGLDEQLCRVVVVVRGLPDDAKFWIDQRLGRAS